MRLIITKQTLAYAEIRSILVRIIWNFDMELKEDSMDWGDQKVYTLWYKPPLNIKLSARKFDGENGSPLSNSL
jgi:hypothetical protein